MLRRAALGSIVFALLACSDSDSSLARVEKGRYKATVFAPLTDAPTTKDRTLVPRAARQSPEAGPNPALIDALESYLGGGFGELDVGPGEAYVTRVIDDSTPPAPGPNAKRLVRFAHLADLQLADDESPTRLGQFDGSGATSSALRPQDAYLCHMANAAVRTINALHAKEPMAFTLMGGDNADSAQTNEVDWVLGILSGADDVECDSGDDDDIVPGPDNDGKDPFKAEGLAMPWKWVTGNHDILVQGNLKTTDNLDKALGVEATGGTRRYDNGAKGFVERGDFVVADPGRALLSRAALMAKVAGHGDGHGLGSAETESGFATYTFDVEGTPIRVLVLDTAHERGGSEGVIKQSQIDARIKPLLDQAKADGKWVILSSHHAASSLGDGTGLGGEKQADAVGTEAWTSFLGQYDNVLFSMVGHSHRHRVTPIVPSTGHPYWEVMTSAIADYPHQFRVVEIFDQDNGWVMLRATCVDFSVEGDPIALEGRRRGIVDFTSGWLPAPDADATHKNVEVWIEAVMSDGAILAWQRVAAAALFALACGCNKKASEEVAPPPAPAEPLPADTVPPVALAGEPLSAFADASAPEAATTPYEQARAYEANGQYWLARLVLEKKAMGEDGSKAELELLGSVCHAQGDEACVAECSRRLGKKLAFAGGRAPAPLPPSEHKEPDTDAARARDHLLRKQLPEARAILEPKVLDGKASKEEIRLLRSVCSDQGDRMCMALCDAKLR